MAQQECDDVKAMLKELGTLVPEIEALKKSIDSGKDIEEIKKTKEELQSVLHKHGMLRYNLKEWERRSKKIQRIDKIAEKLKKEGNDTDLSADELHALYKQEMRGFGDSSPFDFSRNIYSKTEGLRKKRQEEGKAKEDYARIYGCRPDQVTKRLDDVFEKNSNIVVFIGNINFTSKELPRTLKHVSGNLQSDSKNAKLPKNLEYVGGNLNLMSLKEIPAKELVLPKSIGGNLDLDSLTSADGLVLPETIGGYLDLRSLESAKGLVLPKTVGGYLNLSSLESAKGLVLPETIGGGLVIYSLESAKGLMLPKTVGGDLNLGSLTSVEGLKLPKTVGGNLYLNSLISEEGLKLPKTVGGDLYLRSLISAKGLVSPKTVGGSLNLNSLESAEGLEKLNYAGIIGDIYIPKTFSTKDKEEVEKIKTKQKEKGINVTFVYL